jgi:hypothetical protein
MGSVGHAKQQIVRKTGMPEHLLHVWHAGKELLDDSVHVMRYGVEDGSHLQVLVTGLGGLDEDDIKQLDLFANKSNFDFEGNQRALMIEILDNLEQLQHVKDSELAGLGFTSMAHKLRFRQMRSEFGRHTPLAPQQGTFPRHVLSCVPSRRHLWLCVTDLLRVLRLPRMRRNTEVCVCVCVIMSLIHVYSNNFFPLPSA